MRGALQNTGQLPAEIDCILDTCVVAQAAGGRAASEPPLWQVLSTGALMAVTVVVVVWIAGRAFRAGALSTGKIDFKGLIARVRGGG